MIDDIIDDMTSLSRRRDTINNEVNSKGDCILLATGSADRYVYIYQDVKNSIKKKN